jgi:uncharacterized membrane protein YjjB (DUF3815 family)
MIIQVLGAFVAVITVATILSVPRKFLFLAGCISALSWFVYLICRDFEVGVAISTLSATLVIALVSHILARVFKAPVTLFLIPGILPLVPGLNTYRIVYHLIQEDGARASNFFNITLQTAGMIAIGVFIMDTIFRIMNTAIYNRHVLREEKQAIRSTDSMQKNKDSKN